MIDVGVFRRFREAGMELGFGSVFAGPLVRSSYRAEQALAGKNAGVVNAGSSPMRP